MVMFSWVFNCFGFFEVFLEVLSGFGSSVVV